jgi:hypothetical protein
VVVDEEEDERRPLVTHRAQAWAFVVGFALGLALLLVLRLTL